MMLFSLFAMRRWPVLMPVAWCGLAVGLGMLAAHGRVVWQDTPTLERPTPALRVEGVVDEVEFLPGGGARLVLDQVMVEVPGVRPDRIRLRFKTDPAVQVGERIAVRAVLFPPPQPTAPGAYDLARNAWFQGLGASGRALGEVEHLADPHWDGLGRWTNHARYWLTARIMAQIPDQAGAVAAALIAGEVGQISRQTMDDYRDSGLAHMLSISGLHMGMLAGLVFFILRGGLALIPWVALRYPIKKWAALVALIVTFFYMLLAGSPVPAQRSFLMTGIVLLGIMLDRNPISMRLVCWSAVAVLVLSPDSLAGPSFQMSFAAVAAMVAAFEVLTPRQQSWRQRHSGLPWSIVLYVWGICITTIIAGLATAPYAVYHFNRFALWSMAANLVAIPITGVLVMPFALLAMILMPLGLDWLAFIPMGWGVSAANLVAHHVASWPMAAITLPVLPLWGMLTITLGCCWLVLWRRRWRLLGVFPILLGGLSIFLSNPPHLLVDQYGSSFGVRAADGTMLVRRGGKILRETWGRRAGPISDQRWPKNGRSADGVISCDSMGCQYRSGNAKIALVLTDDGVGPACDSADAVISAVPIRQACRQPRLVIDRFDLWRRGAHAVWLDGQGGFVLQSVAQVQGDWPWSHRPHRKPKIKVEPPPQPVQPNALDEQPNPDAAD